MEMEPLSQQQCVPCAGYEERLGSDEIETLHAHTKDWTIVEVDGAKRLQRRFKFHDFTEALLFATKIGEQVTLQKHHPYLHIDPTTVTVDWWTESINGLHRNDFIMAAKTSDIYVRWDEITGDKDRVQEASEESFPASDAPGWTERRDEV